MAERNISSGAWTAHQSNNWDARFNLDQNESGHLSGDVDAFPLGGGQGMRGTVFTGDRSRVTGNSVVITVDWDTGSQGQYVGNFDPQGRLVGNTFDLANPSSQATWFSEEFF